MARPFSGNRAGVLLLEDLSDDTWMQGVADELAQAETAFLAPPGGSRHVPPALVHFCRCGCASRQRHARRRTGSRKTDVLPAVEPAAFDELSGRLTATRDGDRIVLDSPAVPASPVPASDGLLAAPAGPVPVWTEVTDDTDPGERNVLAVHAYGAARRRPARAVALRFSGI